MKKKNITYQELKRRIDNAKGRLKKGEVKKWDKEKQRWVSNKEEDVNEEPNWNDGVNVRFHVGPKKKSVSLNYNGTTIASKEKETFSTGTSPKRVLDKALIDFKNKGTEHIGRNYVAKKNKEKKEKEMLIAKKNSKKENA